MKIFHCAECKLIDMNFDDKYTIASLYNLRDGRGRPIHHVECPVCGNPLSGYVNVDGLHAEDYEYYIDVIGMYQKSLDNGGLLKDIQSTRYRATRVIEHRRHKESLKNLDKYIITGDN